MKIARRKLHSIARSAMLFALTAVCATTLTYNAETTMAEELKAGDTAPAFELKASDGKTYKLEDFKDKKVVVIAWFPKVFTGG